MLGSAPPAPNPGQITNAKQPHQITRPPRSARHVSNSPPSARPNGGPLIRLAALIQRPGNARIGGRGEIAQLVEHSTENRGVGGSSPPLAIAWTRAGGFLAHGKYRGGNAKPIATRSLGPRSRGPIGAPRSRSGHPGLRPHRNQLLALEDLGDRRTGPMLRLERRRLAPTPARDRRSMTSAPGCEFALREPRSPLDVGNERRAELRVVGETGVVGSEAHQRSEAVNLSARRERAGEVLAAVVRSS